MTIKDALSQGISMLKRAGTESCRLESEILLAHSLNRDRIWLHLNPDLQIDPSSFLGLIRRRASGIPIHYILGRREFWSMDFKVGPGILIPRQDTETLVETALDILRTRENRNPMILDLGTGSGCVAIALIKELCGARAVATDISFTAIRTAMENASMHDVGNRFYPVTANWLDPFTPDAKFDMVVSNPPYVAEKEAGMLSSEILEHEPRRALFAGPDGMVHIKKLLFVVPGVLKKGGWFLCETGRDQGDVAQRTAEETGAYREIRIFRDLGGNVRVLGVRT